MYNKEYNTKWVEANREKVKGYQRKYRKKAFCWFDDFKFSMGCSICGYSKCGACLDFHHVNPEDKLFRVTAKMAYYMTPRTLEEIQKCMLLCKNCHYELHYKERQGDVTWEEQ